MYYILPRLMHEDRPMTLDNSTLKDPSMAFALCHSVTPPNDRAILERMATVELGLMGFSNLIRVNLILLSFPPLFYVSSLLANLFILLQSS